MELLSLKGLCHIVRVPQRTAENWIEEFTIYIPKTQQRDGMYYLSEAIDILRLIKKCKYQNFEQTNIIQILENRSFPIRVENPIEDVQMTLDRGNYRDNIVTGIQTIGITVSNVATDEKTNQMQQVKTNRLIKIIDKQTEEIDQLRQEVERLQRQFTTAKEYEMKKSTFAKLFE